MSQVECQVKAISSLTDVVYKVELTPSAPFEFQAGQYAMVVMGEKDLRPFSIANAAFDNSYVELHIGADENNAYAGQVLARMKEEGKITLSGGHGVAIPRPQSGVPIVLIAGGTGFSYTYSILQQLLHDNCAEDITLYWGGRKLEDLYYADKLTALAEQHANFTFAPVVEFPAADWQGRTGWVHQAVLADYDDMSGVQVYIAGRFEMAKVARDDFARKGLPAANLFGDAYAFI